MCINIYKKKKLAFPTSALLLYKENGLPRDCYSLCSQIQHSPILQFSTFWPKSRQLIEFKWCQQFNNIQYSIKVFQDSWTHEWPEMQMHTPTHQQMTGLTHVVRLDAIRGERLSFFRPSPRSHMLIGYSLMQIICKFRVLLVAYAKAGQL